MRYKFFVSLSLLLLLFCKYAYVGHEVLSFLSQSLLLFYESICVPIKFLPILLLFIALFFKYAYIG